MMMIQSTPFSNSPNKTQNQRASEERSRTPNKLSLNKASHRQSKSLARKDYKSENPVEILRPIVPIKEWTEPARYYYISKGNNY